MTDEETRNPEAVIQAAREGVATWHPGDMTQYRVAIDHEQILHVWVCDQSVAIHLAWLPWNEQDYRESGLNPDRYDWWPKVIEPLVFVLGDG